MKARNPSTGNLETVYVKALDSNIVGTILPYAGTTLPTGYMFCDGSAVSRTTYSDLFSAIGTTYGSGDGSTTFNLPNLKGRTVVMQDTTQAEFDTLGETGGSKTDDLSNAYAKVGRSSADYSALQYTARDGSGTFNRKQSQSLGFGGSSDVIVDATELGGSVSRLQPYIILNYIIKVAETRALAGTILNAQNSSTTNTYSCDYINDKLNNKTVLYENANGNNGDITLSDSAGNYDYLVVYWYSNYNLTRTGVSIAPNSGNWSLFAFDIDAGNYQTIYQNYVRYYIYQTSFNVASAKNYSGGNSNSFYITKIVGYK